MANSENKEKSTPPVVAYKTLKNFFRSLAPAMPGRVDKSVMASLSGGTQSQLLHALKALGCISASGAPTERLAKLVQSEGSEYQKTLREALEITYPFLAMNRIDISTVTMQQLREQFEALASGDTVRKCLTFFIPAAKDAGFVLSPYIRELGKRAPTNGKPKKPKTAADKSGHQEGQRYEKPPPPPKAQSWQEMLLNKFPGFDPAWPDEVKAKWFESFEKLMAHGNGASS